MARCTQSEIDVANDTDLPELLSSLGYQVRRVGSCYTTEEMDSLRIWNRRTWYRCSESVGGDAIAFVRHFHGMSFPEVVRYLLSFNDHSVDFPISPPIQRTRPPPRRERPPFMLPPPNGDNRRVIAYLRGRGIGLGVIDGFIRAGLLYEDTAHHNCIFVGYDRAGKAVFATKRGTWDNVPFKCDVVGSDKHITFRVLYDPALDDVRVFESPIDLMSWITLYGRSNAVALCGLYEGPLDTYLRENPGIRCVFLCLDADIPGKEAAERLKEKYRRQGYAAFYELPPHGKDWNQHLQLQANEQTASISLSSPHHR